MLPVSSVFSMVFSKIRGENMKKVFLGALMLAMLAMFVHSVMAVDIGTGIEITMETEKFPPLVWMCDHRIVLDDYVEPGRTSGGGAELIERVENYAFEGEQISWRVLVMDKNGIEKVKDVYVSAGSVQDGPIDIEANCNQGSILRKGDSIDASCNARIAEEELKSANYDNVLQYYDCIFTVETPDSMFGEYWITVEAEDLDGLIGAMKENEFWYLNPLISLNIDGNVDFGKVTPGTVSYSSSLLLQNGADPGSGVLMDMYISGTDFYDPLPTGAKCPTTNQLSLDNFRYFSTNGAYSTQSADPGKLCTDAEGYSEIPHGIKIDDAKEIIGCDEFGDPVPYQPGNVLVPQQRMSLTFKLSLPEPCNGDFTSGDLLFWGEAI
jgi:hypothetical protein